MSIELGDARWGGVLACAASGKQAWHGMARHAAARPGHSRTASPPFSCAVSGTHVDANHPFAPPKMRFKNKVWNGDAVGCVEAEGRRHSCGWLGMDTCADAAVVPAAVVPAILAAAAAAAPSSPLPSQPPPHSRLAFSLPPTPMPARTLLRSGTPMSAAPTAPFAWTCSRRHGRLP